MANESVLYDVSDGVATITLNRPDRLNAMDRSLLDGALTAIENASADREVRAVILTGAGRGFCVGGDLRATNTVRALWPAPRCAAASRCRRSRPRVPH